MPRSVNSVSSWSRRKRILKKTKGYYGRRKNVWTIAKNAYNKANEYARRDSRQRRRYLRSLWIQRINAGARLFGLSYSKFISILKKANVEMNRKVLANLAMVDVDRFGKLVNDVVKGEVGEWLKPAVC